MPIDIDSAPDSLIEALRNRGHSDEEIRRMPGPMAFSEYCNWHGLIGYGQSLWRMVEACKEQDKYASKKL